MSDFLARLTRFLDERGQETSIRQLTPDASTREYFRVGWNGGTAIACVYPEPFRAGEQTYLDATALFSKASLPVAAIFDVSEELAGTIPSENLDVLLTVLAKSSGLLITKKENEIIIEKNPVTSQQ